LIISAHAVAEDKVIVVNTSIPDAKAEDHLQQIQLPAGFKIELFAANVPGARSMALSGNGTVFVGTRGERGHKDRRGKVYAVVDSDKNWVADEVIVLHDDLFMPNGVAYREGSLYVAEPNRILRYDDIDDHLKALPTPVVINDSYPSDIHHGWKYIDFGPDGRLYVPVGAPCNVCESSDQYAVITSIKADGSDKQTVARGIRNTVGFDWHPETGELWFTDNGRDLWGDDRPPEELNRVSQPGAHFGYPYRYGKNSQDDQFKAPEEQFTPAALELPAHTAPLGMAFYTGDMFPPEYRNQILIPHHGSWNRSVADGYYISLVTLVDGEPQPHQIFASGWLQDDGYWGRPVDILQMPDGSILVSDDFAGCIYRISFEQPKGS
jgi:glucose/arabinose dehydrogenase